MSDNPISMVTALEGALAAALFGRIDGISAEAARSAVEAAEKDRTDPLARTLGFGIALALPLYHGGDWQEFRVVVTDGERRALVTASVNLSRIASLEAHGSDARTELLERLHDRTGSIPRDGDRYVSLLLDHPIRF